MNNINVGDRKLYLLRNQKNGPRQNGTQASETTVVKHPCTVLAVGAKEATVKFENGITRKVKLSLLE